MKKTDGVMRGINAYTFRFSCLVGCQRSLEFGRLYGYAKMMRYHVYIGLIDLILIRCL
jgi:hypothetical protein